MRGPEEGSPSGDVAVPNVVVLRAHRRAVGEDELHDREELLGITCDHLERVGEEPRGEAGPGEAQHAPQLGFEVVRYPTENPGTLVTAQA